MKKKEIVILIILLLTNVVILSVTDNDISISSYYKKSEIDSINRNSNSLHQSSDIFEVLDFNDFDCIIDSPYINSTLDENSVQTTCIYNSSIDTKEKDSYALFFQNSSDFEIRINLDYNYTGSYFGDFNFHVMSNYTENYISKYNIIADCSLVDWWTSSGGIYRIRANPFDAIDEHTTSYGTLDPCGNVSFYISRVDGKVNCTIFDNESIVITNMWVTGLNRPANSILIQTGSTLNTVDYAKSTFSNINGTFHTLVNDNPDLTSIFSIPSLLMALTAIFSNLIIIYRQKRKE